MSSGADAEARRREEERRRAADLDKFLKEREAARQSAVTPSAARPTAPGAAPVQPPPTAPPPRESAAAPTEDAIRASRETRVQLEAYHDVVRLRKLAAAHRAKAAKLEHKYRADEARAERQLARAVTARKHSETVQEKAKLLENRIQSLEGDLREAAKGNLATPPEKIKVRIASLRRKVAKLKARSHTYDARAAVSNEKAAKYRSRAASALERSKVHEDEVKNYTRRADNLERAGP